MSLNKIFENVNKLQKQINKVSEINSVTSKLLKLSSDKDIVSNFKLGGAESISNASEIVRLQSLAIGKISSLSAENLAINSKFYQKLGGIGIGARGISSASEIVRLQSLAIEKISSLSAENLAINSRFYQKLGGIGIGVREISSASEIVRLQSLAIGKISSLSTENLAINSRFYQKLGGIGIGVRGISSASEIVRLQGLATEKLLNFSVYKDILSNKNILHEIKDVKKFRRKSKKNKFIKFNGEIENKIVVNINLPPYSKEVVDFLKEITLLLKSLRKSNAKFATVFFITLFYSFGASFRENLMDKITTEIMVNSKQEIKKMVKIYKETNQFNTFSNLGMVTKNDVNLWESKKGEKIISLKYGQIVTYEKMKGKYILIKYKTNNITYEGVILKKYLKKL